MGSRSVFWARLSVVGSLGFLSACSGELLGPPAQDTVPKIERATPAQIAAEPCRFGDLARCAARCDERRDAASCNTVAVMLEYGPANDAKSAASYYGRACASAYAPGCTGLAWLHLLGRGASKDPALAMALFTRAYDGYRLACLQGALEGCVMAADMLIEGRGVEANEREALSMLESACAKGEKRACERAETLRLARRKNVEPKPIPFAPTRGVTSARSFESKIK
jgi:TPR repeat protein